MIHKILLRPIRSSSTSTEISTLKSKRCFKFLIKIGKCTTRSNVRRTIRIDLESVKFILRVASYLHSPKGALEILMWGAVSPWHHLSQKVVLKWSISNIGWNQWLTCNKASLGREKQPHHSEGPRGQHPNPEPMLVSLLWWPPPTPTTQAAQEEISGKHKMREILPNA